jgi:YVTN family beta-propeller protein
VKTKLVLLLSTLTTAALLLIAVFVLLAAFSLTAGLTLAAPPEAVVSNSPYGPHTVEAVGVGTRDPSSSGDYVVVDAFPTSSDCEDAYEPDDSQAEATIVTPPGTTRHTFHNADDVDWVGFQGIAGITYTIETINLATGVDTELKFYSLDGITLTELYSNDDRTPGDLSSLITWVVTTDGWYYAEVGSWPFSSHGCTATYALRISGPPAYAYMSFILKDYPPPPTPVCPIVETTVGVGDRPRGIAVVTATNRIYVANRGSNSLSTIDGGTHTVIGTMDLSGYGSGPNGIAYHPSGLLYVSLAGSDRVAVINASTGTVLGSVGVGDNPAGVAVNPVTGRVYVANFGSGSTALDTVSVISGSTVVGTIPVGDAPDQIAVNPVTNRIFVTNHGHGNNYGEEGSSISVIDGSTDTVIKTIPLVLDISEPGQGPHGIAVNSNTNEIYVAVIDSRQLVVIDGNDLDARPTYITPPLNVPIWMVAVKPDLNRVYAVGCDEVLVHKVFVLDGATNTWITDLDVSTNPKQGVAFSPETGRLYVSNEGRDDVTVILTCSASEPPPMSATVAPTWSPSFNKRSANCISPSS